MHAQPQEEHSSKKSLARGAPAGTQTTRLERKRGGREREVDRGMMNSPNHMASSIMNCVGDEAHEANGASSVDQVDAPLHLQSTQRQDESRTDQNVGFLLLVLNICGK
jgi:hypothetical protein